MALTKKNIYTAFRPGVIKLADPITTDGFTTMNLSERFNPDIGDLGL